MPEVTPQSPGAAPPQQAPFGQSSAMGATANKGHEAAALQRLGVVLKMLETIVPLAGASTEMGKMVLKTINSIAKMIPEGAVTPAAERNVLEQQQMKNVQNQQMMAQMKQGGGAGPEGGQGGQGGQQQPPMAA